MPASRKPSRTGYRRSRRRRRRARPRFFGLLLVLLAIAALIFIIVHKGRSGGGDISAQPTPAPAIEVQPTPEMVVEAQPTLEAEPVPEPTPEPTPVPTPVPTPTPAPTPLPVVEASSVEGTDPTDWKFSSEVNVGGNTSKSYAMDPSIYFGAGDEYTDLPGIITFRGNNFRDTAAFGTVQMTEKKFDRNFWTYKVGALQKVYNSGAGGNAWTGCGWTGQPLLVQWPEETRRVMNLYPEAKNKDGLVEVIYATMDGCIYFFDMETGEPTRDRIKLGFPFKGAGAIDPRGYPLMYVGAGDDSPSKGANSARAFIISLIDGSVLHEFGNYDKFAKRVFYMFDSSALVDAETDTLIYPGEDGVIYFIRLNTHYDPTAGTISIKPNTIKWRYQGKRSATIGVNGKKAFWFGMEDSAVIYQRYLYVADNGGMLMCIDLDTLRAVWIQDTLDDTNDTPVLELEDGHPYLYISTSFHAGWRTNGASVEIPIWKIDGLTGEIVWKTSYKCGTVSGVSGGVQGTIAMGKGDLGDCVYVPVAMTNGNGGLLVALNKSDGSKAWECTFAGYPWSSPVCVYDQNGKGYLLQCNVSGYIHLIDGQTGKILDEMSLGSNVEASPAVFGNKIVVGTRGGLICGIELK